MIKPIGSDFDLILDAGMVITGYATIQIKYQKPLPATGLAVTGFLSGSPYGTGSLKIQVSVPHTLWDTEGDWEFITYITFGDGRILKGEKPFVLTCTSEF